MYQCVIEFDPSNPYSLIQCINQNCKCNNIEEEQNLQDTGKNAKFNKNLNQNKGQQDQKSEYDQLLVNQYNMDSSFDSSENSFGENVQQQDQQYQSKKSYKNIDDKQYLSHFGRKSSKKSQFILTSLPKISSQIDLELNEKENDNDFEDLQQQILDQNQENQKNVSQQDSLYQPFTQHQVSILDLENEKKEKEQQNQYQNIDNDNQQRQKQFIVGMQKELQQLREEVLNDEEKVKNIKEQLFDQKNFQFEKNNSEQSTMCQILSDSTLSECIKDQKNQYSHNEQFKQQRNQYQRKSKKRSQQFLIQKDLNNEFTEQKQYLSENQIGPA